MWLYQKLLMSNWAWLRNATSVQMDNCYIQYKVCGITVAKSERRRQTNGGYGIYTQQGKAADGRNRNEWYDSGKQTTGSSWTINGIH